MDLTRQYIVQSTITAANNLRLSSEKIQVVTMLKDYLNDCGDLEDTIVRMKKITELSKLGIRLGQIYQSITKNSIDFLKLSDLFKEHSHSLVKDLSNLLDIVTPGDFPAVLRRLEPALEPIDSITVVDKIKDEKSSINISDFAEQSESEKIKKEIILEDLHAEVKFDFEDFEKALLNPIKDIDLFFNKLLDNDFDREELNKYIKVMNDNADLSTKIGFDILSNMHKIVVKSLKIIKEGKLTEYRELVEGMRACFIVIVAIVRSKEVDISNYLSKAEKFGKEISFIS